MNSDVKVQPEAPGVESKAAIVRALLNNLQVTALKFVMGSLTGSASMLAEGAHSLADTSTEALLLLGVRHAKRTPKAQYVWALVAAAWMFAFGGLFAIYKGIEALNEGTEVVSLWLQLSQLFVLVASFFLERNSWKTAVAALNVTRCDKGWVEHIRTTSDTSAKTVFFEDSADMFGCVLAFVGNVVVLFSGSSVVDGLASILIGVVLVAMAVELAVQNVKLLRA